MGLSERELRERISNKVESGELPRTVPSQRWAGRATGSVCAGCDLPVRGEDVEVEVDIEHQGRRRVFVFHLHCEAIWEALL